MSYITILPFGKINLDQLKEEYKAKISLAGRDTLLTLLLIDFSNEPSLFEPVIAFLKDLDGLYDKAKEMLREDMVKDGETMFYITHHLEELGTDVVSKLVPTHDINLPFAEQVLQALVLHRISFVPERKNSFCVFDFTLSPKHTQYLLTVIFDSAGDVVDIKVEC